MSRLWFGLISLPLLSCGDSPTSSSSLCETAPLPLAGAANAPTVTDVGLEIQTGGVVLVATASDPQGDGNVQGVLQTIGVFPDDRCAGAPIVMQDDLAYSGVEETFGTVVSSSDNPGLYNTIAAAANWPVEVDFVDLDGNQTTGRVRARVIR
jgi:hypothetical protein